MSKPFSSPRGIIEILEDPKVVAKNIKSATTDSDTVIAFDPENKAGVSNLLTIFSALSGRSIADLEAEFDGKGYGDLKVALADLVVEWVTPFQARVNEYLDDPAELDAVLAAGAEKARSIAAVTLDRVYERSGLLARRARA